MKTEAMAMRTKLLTALIGVTLCLAFASNPNPVLAEEGSADLRPGVCLCGNASTRMKKQLSESSI
jgi:hypothetical protein